MASAEPPLAPSPDEARRELRRELLDPAYQDTDLVGRFLEWFGRQVDRVTGTAASAPPLVTLAAMLLLVALVVGVAWLVSRARWSPTGARGGPVVAAGEVVHADDLAERARRARDVGDRRTAVVEGFRAVAVRAVERGLLADLPGATAREVATTLAAGRPERRDDLHAAAGAFDAALYGDRVPDEATVERVLALDAWLTRSAARTGAEAGS